MKRILLAMICSPAIAFADEAAKPAEAKPAAMEHKMEMPRPGPEHKALAEFFGKSATLAGKMFAGAMGPGSPEMPTKVRQNCKPAVDGFAYVCDVDSTAGAGKQAMHWKGHFVMGYDAPSKTYKAYGADNMGGLASMKGELSGKKLTLTSTEPLTMGPMTFNDRVTWDLEKMTFTDEHQDKGSTEWKLVEEDKLSMAK